MKSILVLLHCESNTGYAIEPLELTFFRMAEQLCDGDRTRIHFAYPSMSRGPTTVLPTSFNQYFVVDPSTRDTAECRRFERFLAEKQIDVVFGFDQPVSRPIYRYMRRAGVRHFISYWGAPMSSLFGPVKRTLKRIEVALRRNGPDHYIFESQGMADFAVMGRGIPRSRTSVVYTGIDIGHWCPDPSDSDYVYQAFDIPKSRRVFFYSGHMEERKGVRMLMRAANRLASRRRADDWQLLLLGNQNGQERTYIEALTEQAKDRVIFGGYRNDLPRLQRGCFAGIIASTGWDSLPRSGLEMLGSGLPVIVSNLPGIREVPVDRVSGLVVSVDDENPLVSAMESLLDDSDLRASLSAGARSRAVSIFGTEAQLANLVSIVRRTISQ